jgi:hypothetical protein
VDTGFIGLLRFGLLPKTTLGLFRNFLLLRKFASRFPEQARGYLHELREERLSAEGLRPA